jgi:hypothetical protein
MLVHSAQSGAAGDYRARRESPIPCRNANPLRNPSAR